MLAERLVERVDDVADLEILGAPDRYREIAPEILQHFLPGDASAGNVVELVLEIGGEIIFDIALEELRQKRGDEAAAIFGNEALLVDPHVVAVLQHLDDRGIGRWPADAELFELLDQARFAVARRRLGEMLLGLDLAAIERIALFERRQTSVVLVVLGIVDVFAVEREIAVERDGRAGRAQHDIAGRRGDIDADLIDQRRRHLARDGALPDQLVEPPLLVIEMTRGIVRAARHVGRADRLVRFLRVLRLRAIDARLVGAIVRGRNPLR